MKRLLISAGLALGLLASAQAAIDTFEFANDAERQRYRSLIEELRCPKCQNQNIADSDAPIAMDLRNEIFRMLEEGKSNEEIIDFLVSRYGDFVLYKPPLTSRTLLLMVRPGRHAGNRLRCAGGDSPAPSQPEQRPLCCWPLRR